MASFEHNELVVAQLQTIQQWFAKDYFIALRMEPLQRAALVGASPIETVFAIWFAAWSQLSPGPRRQITLRPQHEIRCEERTYRVDFALVPTHPVLETFARQTAQFPLPIAVELDGHAFHERTREQVQSRDRRDRDLLNQNWRLFHFSGSELIANPAAVVDEVLEAASPHMQSLIDGVLRRITEP